MAQQEEVVEFRRRSHSLGTELAAHLEQLIVTGHYAPGASLPAERQLAIELGVSRTTVRDALSELESKHLIVRQHGKHSTVALPSSDMLALTERLHPLRDRVEHVVEIEDMVEPGLAGLAALRATAADLLQLEAVHERASEFLPPERSLAYDVEFHYTLARMTRNAFVVAISGLGGERMLEIRIRAHATPTARRAIVEGHAAILAAVRRGDRSGAELAMRDHLEVVHRAMYESADAESDE